MKHWLVKHYQIFRHHPDWYFFYAFLISFPLSMRKIIYFYPIAGQYNEFTAISLYLSDVLLAATLICWLIVLLNNKWSILSIVSCFIQAIKSPYIYLPLILSLTSFLSIIWAENQTISIYRSIKLLEFILLYFYIIYTVSRISLSDVTNSVKHLKSCETFLCHTFWLIFGMGFILAILGLFQFAIQHSIGLFLIKESHISRALPGVAKISLFGKTYLRSYSLFPHPNVFGGFLVMSIFSGLLIKKLFRSTMKNVPPQYKCSTWNILRGGRGTILDDTSNTKSNLNLGMFNFISSHNIIKSIYLSIRETLILAWNFINRQIIYIILLTLFISLILTFSKSAWLVCLVGIAYVSLNHVPHQKKLIPKKWLLYLVVVCVLLAIIYFQADFAFFNIKQSYSERMVYLWPSINMIFTNPLFGIGMGQFVPRMEQFSHISLAPWQFQPVHNVFLLIWSEIGILSLTAFIVFIYQVIKIIPRLPRSKIVPRGTILDYTGWSNFDQTLNIYLKGLLISFIIVMLSDHYLWDIQQGEIMLWLILGFLTGFKLKLNNGCK
jgi:hypothetical protein